MGNFCCIQILACAGSVTSTHENQYIYIRFVMAEEKKSIVESELNPLNHLDPFITGVASSTVFDPDSLLCTHLGLFGLSGFSGLSCYYAMRHAPCSLLHAASPDRPAPIHINYLAGDEI